MDNSKTLTPPLRSLYRLEAAAALAGIKVDLLASSIENGDIPGVRVLHLGPRRLRHVRSVEFLCWINGEELPADKGPEADATAEAAVAAEFHETDYDDSLFQ